MNLFATRMAASRAQTAHDERYITTDLTQERERRQRQAKKQVAALLAFAPTQRALRAFEADAAQEPAEYGEALHRPRNTLTSVLQQPWRLVRNPSFLLERCPRPSTEGYPLLLSLTLRADYSKVFSGTISMGQALDHLRWRGEVLLSARYSLRGL